MGNVLRQVSEILLISLIDFVNGDYNQGRKIFSLHKCESVICLMTGL